MAADEKLAGWRELARSDDEALFGLGTPPQLLTVAVKRGLRNRWSPLGASNARELRAVRDGVRASSWRLDPSFEPQPLVRELRVLVTERTMASGTPAAARLLQPELYLDAERALLRMYVRPLEGYVGRTGKHETPVIVRLPEPLGNRRLLDGALYEPPRAVRSAAGQRTSSWSEDLRVRPAPAAPGGHRRDQQHGRPGADHKPEHVREHEGGQARRASAARRSSCRRA